MSGLQRKRVPKVEAVEQMTLRRLNLNKILLKCSETKERVKGIKIFQVAFIQASAEKNGIEFLSLLTLLDSDPIHASKKTKFLNNF